MICREVCVQTFEEAQIAAVSGGDQLELCSDLDQDGLTPQFGLIERCLTHLSIPIKVMIRPIGGPFTIEEHSLKIVKKQIATVRDMGVKEVVFGFVTPQKELDIVLISQLRDWAYPMNITIHKAIDVCTDPLFEVQRLLQIGGIKSILTSGGRKTAFQGVEVLKSMISLSNNQIEIISAGRITKDNLKVIHEMIGGHTYHGRKIVGELV